MVLLLYTLPYFKIPVINLMNAVAIYVCTGLTFENNWKFVYLFEIHKTNGD